MAGVKIAVQMNKLPTLPGRLRTLSVEMVDERAERAKNRAQELVSVKSGETRDNIKVIVTGPTSRAVQSTRPSTDSDFNVPMFLEIKVKAYLRPAIEEQRSTFISEAGQLILKALR